MFLSGECSLSKSHCQVVMSEGMSRWGCWDLYVGILTIVSLALFFEIIRNRSYETLEKVDVEWNLGIYEE